MEEGQADSTAETNPEVINDLADLGNEDDITVDDGEEEPEEKAKPDPQAVADRKLRTTQRKLDKAKKDYDKVADKLDKSRKPAKELSEEEAKEAKAQEYIEKEARKAIEKVEKEKKDVEKAKLDAFSDELDDQLDSNPDILESDVLDLIESYGKRSIRLSPSQAVDLLKEPMGKVEGKAKPVMPEPKRGSGEVKLKGKEFEEKTKGMTFDQKIEHIKRTAKGAFKKKEL